MKEPGLCEEPGSSCRLPVAHNDRGRWSRGYQCGQPLRVPALITLPVRGRGSIIYLHRGFSSSDHPVTSISHAGRQSATIARMTIRPPVIPKSTKTPASKIADPLDIAARYLVYKLYVPGQSITGVWQPLCTLGEAAATVKRAVERGWVTLRDEGQGRTKERYAALTDEGRVVARKALR
jgi:hypothetical protein